MFFFMTWKQRQANKAADACDEGSDGDDSDIGDGDDDSNIGELFYYLFLINVFFF